MLKFVGRNLKVSVATNLELLTQQFSTCGARVIGANIQPSQIFTHYGCYDRA